MVFVTKTVVITKLALTHFADEPQSPSSEPSEEDTANKPPSPGQSPILSELRDLIDPVGLGGLELIDPPNQDSKNPVQM